MNNRALQGIRVLELGPYVALPLTGRILASLGAEVIKVETNKVLDEMAFIPAWSRGAGQPDFQRAKKRVSIDVRTEGGLEVFRELVKVSDVFMTNFRRNILDRWGIDFPAVRELRPDIILMWQTGLGGIGPYYTYKSYGILVQHMGGVSLMTGVEGDPPSAINTSYSDYHTGVFQPAAIIAALMRRRLTGKTATMESSIFKSGVATCGPALLDYQLNGRGPQRRGNRDSYAVPHGVYPCAPVPESNDDRYIAISAANDEQWMRLRAAMGDPSWAAAPEYETRIGRRRNEAALDAAIAYWTQAQDAAALMHSLQAAGVPAGMVSQGQDLHDSAHLQSRGFYQDTRYWEAERGVKATEWVEGESVSWSIPARMSGTPIDFGKYSNIGEDNAYVFGELLGIPAAEITRLEEAGVIY
jgi:crotonobetainyl-CoA:carnitine CoA-transferase CaiB-like acyl-CoA transferase